VTVGGMLIRGGSRALRQPPLASVPEANQERCTLVDMQFLPVLPCFGFASASHDFVGTAGGIKDIWRGCRHTRSHIRARPQFVCVGLSCGRLVVEAGVRGRLA
jgi:hypothetical protein